MNRDWESGADKGGESFAWVIWKVSMGLAPTSPSGLDIPVYLWEKSLKFQVINHFLVSCMISLGNYGYKHIFLVVKVEIHEVWATRNAARDSAGLEGRSSGC